MQAKFLSVVDDAAKGVLDVDGDCLADVQTADAEPLTGARWGELWAHPATASPALAALHAAI